MSKWFGHISFELIIVTCPSIKVLSVLEKLKIITVESCRLLSVRIFRYYLTTYLGTICLNFRYYQDYKGTRVKSLNSDTMQIRTHICKQCKSR